MYHNENSNSRTSAGHLMVEIRRKLFVLSLIVIVMGAVAVSGVEQGAVETGADENIEADANNVSQNKAIQSITFKKDISIRDALRFLAAKYHKNIIPSPSVDGFVTVTSLYDVTFEQALSAILGNNFRYDQEGNFIKVYTAEEYKKIKADKDRMIYRVFTLHYISAAEALKLIAPVVSGAGTIQGSSPAEKVVPTGESIGGGSGGGDTMALNDTIVILDYPENIAKAEKLLKELDVRPKQVLIEATILSATLNEETALGIDWNALNGVAVDTIARIGSGIADGVATGGFAYGLKTTNTTATDGFSAGVTNDHVAVLIRALEEVTDVTVLANPKILAVNKQLGQVYIGKKYGYFSQTTVSEGGTSTSQVSFLETGTKLSFRPYIGNDGYIRMDIHPKDSDGSVTNSLPYEQSTEVATNIMVKDGQTIVIGGLFRDTVNTARKQVPLLGDLPIIGAAFRSTVDKVKREEVIVMLTPHIIEEPQDTKALARAEDIARKSFGAKQELQWVGRARLAEDHYTNAVRYYADNNTAKAIDELDMALELRPTYLEAIRLKERIIEETDPQRAAKMERVMLGDIDKEVSDRWMRR